MNAEGVGVGAGFITRTLRIGRTDWVFGLEWFSLPASDTSISNVRREIAGALRKLALSPGTGHAVIVDDNDNHQYAIAGMVVRKRSYSAAAAIAVVNRAQGDVCLFVELPEGAGYWLCHTRDGAVIGDGDMVFAGERRADAIDRFRQGVNETRATGSSVVVYVPESVRDEIGLPGTLRVPRLTDLLADPGTVEVRGYGMRRSLRPFALGVAIVVICGAIGYLAASYFGLVGKRVVTISAPKVDVPAFVETVIVPPYESYEPWSADPSAASVLDRCQQAITLHSVAVVGWRSGPLSCSSTSVPAGRRVALTGSWTRIQESIVPASVLIAAVEQARGGASAAGMTAQWRFLDVGSTVQLDVALGELAGRGAGRTALWQGDVISTWASVDLPRGGAAAISISRSGGRPPFYRGFRDTLGIKQSTLDAMRPVFIRYRSPLPPLLWLEFWGAMPGAVIDTVERVFTSGSGSEYIYTGHVFTAGYADLHRLGYGDLVAAATGGLARGGNR